MNWVGSWAAAQQLTESANLPPAPGLAGNTLRQLLCPTLSGERVRLLLSNEYGEAPLVVGEARLARAPAGGASRTSEGALFSFGGSPRVVVPEGEARFSDPVAFPLQRFEQVAVSTYFESVPKQLTGHPGSRTTSYLARGNEAGAALLSDFVTADHWYVVAGLDVDRPGASAVVTLGDSLTDGRGSTTNGNDRWPDVFARRLAANPATAELAVLNAGIGGNTVLEGGLGPSALARFGRDVVEQRGVSAVVLMEGVNDLGISRDARVTERLIDAYRKCIDDAQRAGIACYAMPILPFAGSSYDTPQNRAARHRVNDWIRSGGFTAVIDVETAVSDPSDRERLHPAYHDGDHLHLNALGYRVMAEAVDSSLFARRGARS